MLKIKKTNADYKREQYARKKKAAETLGVVDRVLPVSAGMDKMIKELCERHDFTDWRELIFTMVRVCHGGAHELAVIPKSGFVPTEAQLFACGEPCTECGGTGDGLDTELCPNCNSNGEI